MAKASIAFHDSLDVFDEALVHRFGLRSVSLVQLHELMQRIELERPSYRYLRPP